MLWGKCFLNFKTRAKIDNGSLLLVEKIPLYLQSKLILSFTTANQWQVFLFLYPASCPRSSNKFLLEFLEIHLSVCNCRTTREGNRQQRTILLCVISLQLPSRLRSAISSGYLGTSSVAMHSASLPSLKRSYSDAASPESARVEADRSPAAR